MEGWKELVLSLPGLPNGVKEIKTTVTTDFFTQFEQSPIAEASYDVQVVFDKKPGLYIMDLNANGWRKANCDRCLERIKIPHETSDRYYFRVKNLEKAEDVEGVIALDEGTVELDLRSLVYESIILSMPMVNVYNCEYDEQAPCDKRVLEILRNNNNDSDSTNPTWDVLKNLNFEE